GFIHRIHRRIAGGKLTQFCQGAVLILPEKKMPAIRESGEKRWIFGVQHIAKTLELEFAHNARLEQTTQVGQRRHFVSSPRLFRDTGATQHGPAFEHQGLQSSPGEICCRDQPIVSAANDDGIKALWHTSPLPARTVRWQLSTSYFCRKASTDNTPRLDA